MVHGIAWRLASIFLVKNFCPLICSFLFFGFYQEIILEKVYNASVNLQAKKKKKKIEKFKEESSLFIFIFCLCLPRLFSPACFFSSSYVSSTSSAYEFS